MGTPASALGGSAGIINAVGNLLPTTTTASGHTETSATANSDTRSGEFNLSKGSTIGVENSKSTGTTKGNSTGTTSELGTNKGTNTTIGSGNEVFSGQNNSTTTQTMLTDQGVMRIVNMMLQGNGGVPGLAETVSGERAGNLYNSSTNTLLTGNLVSTIGGEVARLSAPTVQNQTLGSTNTQTSQNTSQLMDAISSVIAGSNQNTSSTENKSGQTTSQQDVLNMVLGLAQQLTDQSSESVTDNKTKTKTKKFPSYICTWLESILGEESISIEFEALRAFKATYLIPYQPRLLLVYDVIGPMIVIKLESLEQEDQLAEANRLRTQFILPAAEKYRQEDNLGSLSIYTEMVLTLHDKYIRGV